MKATKPVILAVDDHPPVLSAVLRDLRSRYGKDYRLLGAQSGSAALGVLKDLARQNKIVALMVVDQRMPGMSGIEFLREALSLFPGARRVLLTAYSDTDAAIRAINEIDLDHYLLKPWDPPEERLYPVLDDLLDDWRATFEPPFEGVQVVSHRWSSEGHRVKDYLTRNQIPYRWFDVEGDPEAERLLELAQSQMSDGDLDPASRPLVFFPDGSHLSHPSRAQLALKLGIREDPRAEAYDVVIIGGGPAGLAAAVYSASEGLSTLVVEKEAPGGQAGLSSRIENYLGFPSGLSGSDLTRRALAQAKRFGAEILTPAEAKTIRSQGDYRIVTLADESEIVSQAVVIATGVSYETLNVPGMEKLNGRGVYYGAALTEALTVRDQDVFIVGGGNSAGQAAVYLADFARSVTLLVRSRGLSQMSRYLIDKLNSMETVRIRLGVEIEGAIGRDRLECLQIHEKEGNKDELLPAAALFVFVGGTAKTEWLSGIVERDRRGFLLTGPDVMKDGKRPRGWTERRDPFLLETSTSGIFAAGDIRRNSVKRIASAVGEGAMAIQFIHGHLASKNLAPRPRRISGEDQ